MRSHCSTASWYRGTGSYSPWRDRDRLPPANDAIQTKVVERLLIFARDIEKSAMLLHRSFDSEVIAKGLMNEHIVFDGHSCDRQPLTGFCGKAADDTQEAFAPLRSNCHRWTASIMSEHHSLRQSTRILGEPVQRTCVGTLLELGRRPPISLHGVCVSKAAVGGCPLLRRCQGISRHSANCPKSTLVTQRRPGPARSTDPGTCVDICRRRIAHPRMVRPNSTPRSCGYP